MIAIGCPLGFDCSFPKCLVAGVAGCSRLGIKWPEDERDPSPPDEDDDTVGADWDEMGYWDLDGDEGDDDED